MRLRSMLFVPGDRPDRMAKALHAGADALILDLEDAVAPDEKAAARVAVRQFVAAAGHSAVLFVRVNAVESNDFDADLDAVADTGAAGIMLPKCDGADSLARLDRALAARGDRHCAILPIAVETPHSLFRLHELGGVTARLTALTWGAEDLNVALGAASNRDDMGMFTGPFALARNLTLYGAAVAGVPAIETVYPAVRDLDGLARQAARAASDGFSGMMAIHPDQVAPINAAFAPAAELIEEARAIIAAFDEQPGAGVLTLNGRMIDAAHYKRAQRLLLRVA